MERGSLGLFHVLPELAGVFHLVLRFGDVVFIDRKARERRAEKPQRPVKDFVGRKRYPHALEFGGRIFVGVCFGRSQKENRGHKKRQGDVCDFQYSV